MNNRLRFLTILLVLLSMAGPADRAAATQQTLTGREALDFLQETGIFSQLAAEAGGSFSPAGREFFQLQPIGETTGEADDLFGIAVSVDGNTALVGVSQDHVDGQADQGSAYVYVLVEGSWARQAHLTADDGAAGDEFGFAVALDGDTALVGAPAADVAGQVDQGAAYIFTRDGFTWSAPDKLVADTGLAGDEFGRAVALDGGTALVGAPLDDIDGQTDQGAAFVFTESGGTWSQQTRLVTPDTNAEDQFGAAVALDGGTALVGAPFEDIGVDDAQGAAYVFTGAGSSWSQQDRLVTGDGQADDQLGGAVALSGDTAVVGAHLAAVDGDDNAGAAYVFTREMGDWSLEQKLSAEDGAAGDRLGRSVAVDGDTALLGAPMANIDGNGNQGTAYVFIREAGNWSQQSKLTDWAAGEMGDRFGRAVALDGDSALVGAIYGELASGNADRGVVYPFARSSVPWLPNGEAEADEGNAGDESGFAVAVEGSTALVGAPYFVAEGNSGQGAVFVFERTFGNWTQVDTLRSMDGSDEWRFGYTVALDGDIAVVGAPGLNSVVDLGGAAYVYVREGGSNWIQYDKLTAPVRVNRDWFGYSVALDGETVLVGTPFRDIDGNDDQGAAYVFTRSTNSDWTQQDRLLAVDGAEGDEFGTAVALDGNSALVGAYLADIQVADDNQGAAYVFTREGNIWSHQAKLMANDGDVSDWFGVAVALEGDLALVGATLANVDGQANRGAAYVFSRSGNNWSQQDKLTAPDGAIDDRLGNALALDGNTALVGASLADVDGTIDRGAAYVFTYSGSDGWILRARLTAGDGAESDSFASSVALDGNTVLLGAPFVSIGGNQDQGKAYFFLRQPFELFLALVVR